MAGWLGALYEYWREVIIAGLAALFLVAGFIVLYPVFWYVPPALRYLLMTLLPITFVVLAVITMSFLPFTFDWWGVMYEREPVRWIDFRIIHEKYRFYFLMVAAGNLLYLLCLGGYLLCLGDRKEPFLSSLSAGIPILLSWLILNCALLIACGVMIYLSEPS